MSKERPNKHPIGRTVAAGAIVVGGITGSIAIGKIALDSFSGHPKSAPTVVIPKDEIPSQKEFNERVRTITPDEAKALATATTKPTETPIPEPTVTATATATATPKIETPLELAMKQGRIELKGGNDWQNYFEPITKAQAVEALAKVNDNIKDAREKKIILQIDPRTHPNLVVETVEFEQSPGIKETVIGIKGLRIGDRVPAPASGDIQVSTSVAQGKTKLMGAIIDDNDGNTHYMVTIRREGSETAIPPKQKQSIKAGGDLFTLGTEEPEGFFEGNQQVVIQIYSQELPNIATIAQFYPTPSGKIAFIGN